MTGVLAQYSSRYRVITWLPYNHNPPSHPQSTQLRIQLRLDLGDCKYRAPQQLLTSWLIAPPACEGLAGLRARVDGRAPKPLIAYAVKASSIPRNPPQNWLPCVACVHARTLTPARNCFDISLMPRAHDEDEIGKEEATGIIGRGKVNSKGGLQGTSTTTR